MSIENNVLDFVEGKNDLLRKRIFNLPEERKDVLLLVGTVPEKIVLAEQEYGLSMLARDPSPEVRKEVVKHMTDLRPFYNDPSSIVRHTVALQLKNILDCTVPEIRLDKSGMPYVVDTIERQMMNGMIKDISVAVSTVAKQAMDNLKKREIKEAVNTILGNSGLEDVSCSLAKDLEKALQEKFNSKDIEELPVRSSNYFDRKDGIDR